MQQFMDGVMLRMCCGLTLATLFIRFFDRYYVATIPKSRFEFLDSFLIFFSTRQSNGLHIRDQENVLKRSFCE